MKLSALCECSPVLWLISCPISMLFWHQYLLWLIVLCVMFSTIILMLVQQHPSRRQGRRLVWLCLSLISCLPALLTATTTSWGRGAARPRRRPHTRRWGRRWNESTLHWSSWSMWVCVFALYRVNIHIESLSFVSLWMLCRLWSLCSTDLISDCTRLFS